LETTTFPSKKIFGSFAPSTIEYRKLHLNKFLAFLSEKYKADEIVQFLEFLEIKKRIEMLQRNPQLSVESNPVSVSDAEKNTKDVEKLLGFIYLFNKNQKDIIKLCREFENFFFDTKPRLSKEAVKGVLLGDSNLQGLLQLCGKFDFKTNSHLTCNAGLNLLLNLLDHEHNKDAELFKLVFANASLRDISCLFFDDHILQNKTKTSLTACCGVGGSCDRSIRMLFVVF